MPGHFEVVDVIKQGSSDSYDGNVYWNLKNAHNRDVAPGLYIYRVETENGLTKVGKFAVVR